MTERVLITGYGCITAAGDNAEQTWSSIKQQQSGIDQISLWDVSDWKYKLAGELKNYNARKMVSDRKLIKLLSRHDIIGLNAVSQALEHSGLLTYRDALTDTDEFSERTGIFAGSPGNKYQQQYDFMPLISHSGGKLDQFAKYLFDDVHPMWLLRILPNNVLAYTGIQYGFKGVNQNITNHAVSGVQAILEATMAIKSGLIDRAIVVSYDSCVEPQALYYYSNMGLVSETGVKTFDQNRDGTVFAEGAGAMILESASSADKRQARAYGEILSGASASEANGIFSLSEDGEGLQRIISSSLKRANIEPSQIGMIVAHGNGNKKSDASEANAIFEQFGSCQVPVTAFKWAFGHTLTASGVIESIMCLSALREQIVPGIPTLESQAEDCKKILVNSQSNPINKSLGLLFARGFSSMNACVIIKSLTGP